MRGRLTALLLVLVAVLGISLSAPQPAAADGPISKGASAACKFSGAGLMDTLYKAVKNESLCDKLGSAVEKKIKQEWDNVWKGPLGDIIKSAEDVAKFILKKVLSVALMGPSLDLKGTGLWGGKSSLSGMLVWLGLVIAAAGVMWQLGKMALTGQAKHAGRAMLGWVENMVLSIIGVSLFATLLTIGDAFSTGLVNGVFENDDQAFERIIAVMIPKGIGNPVLMLGVVQLLVIVGFVQLIMVFLRQSAIPIICLLLPVAGGGRAGGDVTRQWAPKLITSGLVIVAYKPMLALIMCVGFAEFGHSETLAEWLRGCATLILAILAPGPLSKVFAPFGAAVGGGMAAGGMGRALGAAADFFGRKYGGDGGSGGHKPTSPMDHAQYVERQMGKQGGEGQNGGRGGDAQAQAARNNAQGNVPAQAGPQGAPGAPGNSGQAPGTAGTGTAGTATVAGPAGAAVAAGIQVLDGVNNTIQGAGGQMGGGTQQ